MNTVYIGYDPKEDTSYEVLKFTIERISGKNIRVVPLRKDILEHIGMYTRKSEMIKGQPYDVIDGKPFSTEFSFSRFLVPALNMYQGKALFMDSDMYLRADVNELFEMCDMDYYVTDKITSNNAITAYNRLIRNELLKNDWISEVYSNSIVSILKNNNPGDDCIG